MKNYEKKMNRLIKELKKEIKSKPSKKRSKEFLLKAGIIDKRGKLK